jgi:hypothetical protein
LPGRQRLRTSVAASASNTNRFKNIFPVYVLGPIHRACFSDGLSAPQ